MKKPRNAHLDQSHDILKSGLLLSLGHAAYCCVQRSGRNCPLAELELLLSDLKRKCASEEARPVESWVSTPQGHPREADRVHLLDVEEVCQLLRIGRTNFYELVKQGRLKTVKVGRRTRVSNAAIEQFMREIGA